MSQFVFYPQQDPDDCGVSVLRMVAKYHGLAVSAKHIRQVSSVPYGELSMLALSRAAESIGFNALSLRLSSDELDQQIQLPAIAHFQGQHYIVVERIGSKHVHISDPAYGRYKLKKKDFQERWGEHGQGVLLALEPSSRFKPKNGTPQPKIEPSLTFPTVDGLTWLQIIIECLILITFFQLLHVLTSDLPPKGFFPILITGSVTLLCWVSLSILNARWSRWKKRIQSNWISDLEVQISERFSTSQENDLEGYQESQWIAKMTSSEFLIKVLDQFLRGVRGSAYTVVLTLYLFWVHPWAGASFLVFAISMVIYTFLLRKSHLGDVVTSFEGRISYLIDSWNKGLGMEWQIIKGQPATIHASNPFLTGYTSWLYWLLSLLWIFSAILCTNEFSPDKPWSISLILAGIMAFYGLREGLNGYRAYSTRHMLLPGYENLAVESILDPLSLPEEDIRLVEQDTTSEKGDDVLEILQIPWGASILLFGEDNPERMQLFHQITGDQSGEKRKLALKTTIFDKDLCSEWRRTRMVIRRQTILPVLSLGEFITGQKQYTMDDPDVEMALQGSLLTDIVAEWPDGLDTIIGLQSLTSQSISQQILLARALYQQPPWLILDEVFRHLDPFREQIILENLLLARKGMTTLVFNRRIELTGQVDWIIHIREGEVIEQGSLYDLINNEGYLYSLITSS